MSFVRLKLVENKQEGEGNRNKIIFVGSFIFLSEKYGNQTLDCVDIDDVVVVVNHESNNVTEVR